MDNFLDYFTRQNLLTSLLNTPYIPGFLGQLGIFQQIPLDSTTYVVEVQPEDKPGLPTKVARGSPPNQNSIGKRKVETFPVMDGYEEAASVYADEVLNMRARGVTAQAELVSTRRDEKMRFLRNKLDLAFERDRMAVLKAPNNVLGSQPANQVIALGTSATKTRQAIMDKITVPLEFAMKGIPFGKPTVICSQSFFSALIANDEILKTYLNWTAAAQIRGDARDAVDYGGVLFVRYRGDGTIQLDDGTAVAVPSDIQGGGSLFVQCFAPHDSLDSAGAGALGQPYYTWSDVIKGNKGWELWLSSHPLMLCHRPQAVLPLSLT